MSAIHRTKPTVVWPRYQIVIDLYAIRDDVVEDIVNRVDDLVGERHEQGLYLIGGNDPEEAEDEAAS